MVTPDASELSTLHISHSPFYSYTGYVISTQKKRDLLVEDLKRIMLWVAYLTSLLKYQAIGVLYYPIKLHPRTWLIRYTMPYSNAQHGQYVHRHERHVVICQLLAQSINMCLLQTAFESSRIESNQMYWAWYYIYNRTSRGRGRATRLHSYYPSVESVNPVKYGSLRTCAMDSYLFLGSPCRHF